MANIHTVQVRFDASKAKKEAAQFDNSMEKLDKRAGGLGGMMGKLSGLVGAIGFGMMARDMAQTIIETEKMKGSLQTMTGSMENANAAFGALQEFASTTPFTMDQSVQAFIKMKSLGLEPTADALSSFGNTASAMGKDLNQMIEAVADASTGEFERLKEFGIKAKSEGDKVSFVFQGVTTTVGKNAAEITDYLKGIGNEKFGDAMALQMERLPGQLSNLRDSVQNLWRTLGDQGVTSSFARVVGAVSDGIKWIQQAIESGFAVERIRILLDAYIGPFRDAFASIGTMFKNMTGGMEIDWKLAFGFIPYFFGEMLDWFALIPKAWQATVTTILEYGGAMIANMGDEWAGYVATAERAWENVAYAGQYAWQVIKLGFATMQDWVIEGFSTMLGKLSAAVKKLPFGEDMAKSIDASAKALKGLAKNEKEVRKEMAESKKAHDDQIDVLNEGIKVTNANMTARLDAAAANSQAAWDEVGAEKDLIDARQAAADALLEAIETGESYEDVLARLAKGAGETETATKDMTGAFEELDRLKGIIDPGTKAFTELKKELAAMNKVREELEAEGKFFSKGFWEDMEAGLEKAILGTESLGGSMQNVGKLAGDALRQIQSSINDGTKAYDAMNVAIQAANVVAAIGAILNQANGDPYTAGARMAAMAALVASLGAFSGSIGALQSGFTDTAADRQESQGTGTVLGDAKAKSESIARAVEITADATEELVGINRGMLYALEAMVKGISGASGSLARGAGDAGFNFNAPSYDFSNGGITGAVLGGGIGSFLMQGTWLAGPIAGIIGTIVGGLFGSLLNKLLGGKSKITDQGVAILGGTLAEIIDGTLVKAYQEVQYKKWRFGSKKTKEELAELGGDAASQIGLIFESMGTAVREGALALGIEADVVQARMESFRVAEQRISLKDLTAEEQQAELEAVFSSIFDDLAGHVVPFVADFQKIGEGLGETLIRVATTVQVFQQAMGQLGLAVDETDPEAFAHIAVGLVEMTGGIDSFIGKMKAFVNRFATDEHQFTIAGEALHKAFFDVGLVVPETADGLWELMTSLDASTEAGQRQIATILDLTSEAGDYYSMLEDKQAELEDQRQAVLDNELAALQQIDSVAQAVASRFENLRGMINEFLDPSGFTDYTARLDELFAALSVATDAGEIDRLTQQIDQTTRQAWAGLSEDQKRSMGQQFIDMLDEGERLASERLAIAKDLVIEESAKQLAVIEAAMASITDPFKDVVAALQAAADDLADAATDLGGGDGSGEDLGGGDGDFDPIDGRDTGSGNDLPAAYDAAMETAANALANEGAAYRAAQATMTNQLAGAIASIPGRIVVQVTAPGVNNYA